MKKRFAFILAALLSVVPVQAHIVQWFAGVFSLPNNQPLRLVVGKDPTRLPGATIVVSPATFDEVCTVTVNLTLDPITTDYLDVSVEGGGSVAAISKYIDVRLKQAPPSSSPLTLHVKGTWQATGNPIGDDCTAIFPNDFDVPVEISLAPEWVVALNSASRMFTINTGRYVGLQEACSPVGPWSTIGLGTQFALMARMETGARYYRDNTALGGTVWGMVYDGTGNPLSGVTIELPGGGATVNPDQFGNYQLGGLPWGNNQFHIYKPILIGQTQYKVGLKIDEIPSQKPFTKYNYYFDANAGAVPGNQYVGWTAIGAGVIDTGKPSVYFDGGLRRIDMTAPWNPAGVQITITPPDGKTFELQRGQDHYLDNALNGTWKIDLNYQTFRSSSSVKFGF